MASQIPIDLSSLVSCAFKVFEHLIHTQIAPHIFLQLDECSGGFQWFADVMSHNLFLPHDTIESSHISFKT